MARKKPTFTGAELRLIKEKLKTHIHKIILSIRETVATFDPEVFADVIDLRDLSQTLTSSLLGLQNMDLFISNADLTGEKKMLPFDSHDIGLDIDE